MKWGQSVVLKYNWQKDGGHVDIREEEEDTESGTDVGSVGGWHTSLKTTNGSNKSSIFYHFPVSTVEILSDNDTSNTSFQSDLAAHSGSLIVNPLLCAGVLCYQASAQGSTTQIVF